jgi:hypothetical protein
LVYQRLYSEPIAGIQQKGIQNDFVNASVNCWLQALGTYFYHFRRQNSSGLGPAKSQRPFEIVDPDRLISRIVDCDDHEANVRYWRTIKQDFYPARVNRFMDAQHPCVREQIAQARSAPRYQKEG